MSNLQTILSFRKISDWSINKMFVYKRDTFSATLSWLYFPPVFFLIACHIFWRLTFAECTFQFRLSSLYLLHPLFNISVMNYVVNDTHVFYYERFIIFFLKQKHKNRTWFWATFSANAPTNCKRTSEFVSGLTFKML